MSTESNPAPEPLPVTVAAPRPAAAAAIDAMPYDRRQLAGKSPDQRAAIYLNSIRRMMVFFTVVLVIGIIAGVVFAILVINAVHSVQQSGSTGFGLGQ